MQALSGIIDQVTTLEERLNSFSGDQAHMGERLISLEGVVEGNMATLLDQMAELSSKGRTGRTSTGGASSSSSGREYNRPRNNGDASSSSRFQGHPGNLECFLCGGNHKAYQYPQKTALNALMASQGDQANDATQENDGGETHMGVSSAARAKLEFKLVCVNLTLDYVNTYSTLKIFYLDSEGTNVGETWEAEKEWVKSWSAPRVLCDIYDTCGFFGICNISTSQICSCLKGFRPKFLKEWTAGNWSGGCVRRTQLQYERSDTNGKNGKKDVFLKLERVKVPDFANWVSAANLQDCKQDCLNNCSCVAHSYVTGIGCMLWNGDLLDMQKFDAAGVDLYIRVAGIELSKIFFCL
ncbi:hypothetical protein GIB67_014152 [Kingdonia uniflora]|uniref:Apple domain-containing protein n=1 Tax=Kingdonia uniflora TaxID=39325 RepID=A0A7J7N4J3_9MAGN|nr:hypothetical protein GIB67_014152 [Kingdonia uniflora]